MIVAAMMMLTTASTTFAMIKFGGIATNTCKCQTVLVYVREFEDTK